MKNSQRSTRLRRLIMASLLLVFASSFAAAAEITFLERLMQGTNGVDGMTGASDPVVSPDGRTVYVAAYAASSVAIFTRNTSTGQLTYFGKFTHGTSGAAMLSAFSVDVSPDGKNVYVGSPSSRSVVAFTRDANTGALTFLQNNVSGTDNPAVTGGFVSVTVSPDGKSVYGIGGSPSGLVVFSRNPSTGLLTYVEDQRDNVNGNLLGQLFGATGSPINNIAISIDGAFLYVTSTTDHAVSVYSRNTTTGALTLASAVQDNVGGVDGIQAASSLVLSPDNKFLYVSGQGESSVAVFSRDAITGALTYFSKQTQGANGITTLQGARSLAVSPDGRYVYASAITSNSITVFNRNATTGGLTLATSVTQGSGGVDGIGSVSGMVTDPLSQNLYAAGQSAGAIAVFKLPVPAVVLASTTLTVTENGAALPLDSALTVLDADDANLQSARAVIDTGFISTDTLLFTAQPGIATTYDSATHTLNMVGNATLADYQTLLRSVHFQAGDDSSINTGQTSTREIYFQVSDGTNESAQARVTVTVNGVSAPPSYALTYSAGPHGSLTGSATQSVVSGHDGTAVTAVPDADYHFVQWSDGSTANPRTDVNVTANLSVSATFAVNPSYTLTYTADPHGSVTGSATQSVLSARDGTAVTAVADAGYRFVQWSDGSTANPRTEVNVTADFSVTASFAINQFNVTATAGPGGSISPGSAVVNSGSTATFAITPSSGFAINRISGCGDGTFANSAYTTGPITGACTLTVTFREVQNIDVTARRGGRGAMDSVMLIALSALLLARQRRRRTAGRSP